MIPHKKFSLFDTFLFFRLKRFIKKTLALPCLTYDEKTRNTLKNTAAQKHKLLKKTFSNASRTFLETPSGDHCSRSNRSQVF